MHKRRMTSAWNREHFLKKFIFDTNLDCHPNLIPSLLFYTLVWEGSKDWTARVSNSLVILGRDQIRSTATLESFKFRPMVWAKSACFKIKLLSFSPSYIQDQNGQHMHFWLFLKLFVQLGKRFTMKISKVAEQPTCY